MGSQDDMDVDVIEKASMLALNNRASVQASINLCTRFNRAPATADTTPKPDRRHNEKYIPHNLDDSIDIQAPNKNFLNRSIHC